MKFVTDTSFGNGSNDGAGAIVLEPSGGSYAMNFYVTTGSTEIVAADKVFGIENDDKFNVYAPAEFHKDIHIDGTIYAKEEQIDSIVYNTMNFENAMLQALFYDMSGDFATEFIIGTGYGGLGDLSINGISLISLREDISNNVPNHPQDSDSTEIITTGSKPKELVKDISGKEILFMTKNNISSLTGQNTYTKILGNINHLRDTVADTSNNGSIFNNVVAANNFSDLKYSLIYIYISTSGNGDDEPTDRTRMSAKYNEDSQTSFTNLETGTPDISDSGYTHPYNKVYGLYHKLDTPDTLSNILTNTTFSAWRDNSGQAGYPDGVYYSINEIYILVKGAADIFDITGTKFQIMKQSDTEEVGIDNLFVVDGDNGVTTLYGGLNMSNNDIIDISNIEFGNITNGTFTIGTTQARISAVDDNLWIEAGHSGQKISFAHFDSNLTAFIMDMSNQINTSMYNLKLNDELDMSGNNITDVSNLGIGTSDPSAALHILKVNDISFTTATDSNNTAYNMILEKNASSTDV